MNSNTILLLGARAPIALELARSFHSKQYRVILADSLRFPIGRWSNTIVKYERLPSPRQDSKKYASVISDLVLKYEISHIVPTCEEAFYVARYKDNWNCMVWTPDIQVMDALHNKETFALKFSGLLNIPETISLDNFFEWTNSHQYVFKPKYSRFGNQTIINTTISAETISEPENWIAQKKVLGKEICSYSIWDAGKLKGYSCYEPLYRAGKGSGIFFKHVKNKKIKKEVENFGKEINYTGQLSFDIIISNDTAWFIECNPRGTSGAHLLDNRLADCFFNKEETTFIETRDFMLTSLMFLTHPFNFFFKKVRRAKDVIFRINDPLPAIAQVLSILELIFIKLSKGIDLLEATTHDIEWNGHED